MVPAEHYDDADDKVERSPAAVKLANLQSFRPGDPRASEAGKRGSAVRRERSEARRLLQREAIGQLQAIRETFDRDQLGPLAAAAAMHAIGEVVAGRMRVRDPAAWVRVLVDVARLEAGEVTSATATVNVDRDDVARAIALRDMARRALDVGADVDVDQADE